MGELWDDDTPRLYYFPPIANWRPKLLFKECPAEYYPTTVGNVQIGSLNYFRKHHQEEIADKQEGITTFDLQGRGSWAEVASWLNNSTFGMFGGAVRSQPYTTNFPGSWPVNWLLGRFTRLSGVPSHDLDVDDVPGVLSCDFYVSKHPKLDIVEARSLTHYSASNAFIFCMKKSPPSTETLRSYNSHWVVDADNVMALAEDMAGSLCAYTDNFEVSGNFFDGAKIARELGEWCFKPLGALGPQSPPGPYVLFAVGDVIYVGEGNTVNLSKNYPWDWFKYLLVLAPLFKSPDFADQEETRIIFYLVYWDGSTTRGINPVSDLVRLPLSNFIRKLTEK